MITLYCQSCGEKHIDNLTSAAITHCYKCQGTHFANIQPALRADREPTTEAVLARALKNEAAFHCLLHHCQRALSMPGPHTFDKELSDGVHAAIAISHGEKTPMKLHFDNDWVKRTTAADPDVDIEAGPDIALKGKGASQGDEDAKR